MICRYNGVGNNNGSLMNSLILCRVFVFAALFTASLQADDRELTREVTREGVVIPSDGAIRLNQIQVLATHNSYKKFPPLAEDIFLHYFAEAIEYEHPPLVEQLEHYQVRGLEIDVYADPAGGHFQHMGNFLTHYKQTPEEESAYKQPGFKVFHIPDLDFLSHCIRFQDCLQQIRSWSLSHPLHSPIFINVETKDEETVFKVLSPFFNKPIAFSADLLAALEAEVLQVFPAESILKPDDLRVGSESIRASLKAKGWPLLSEVRGKVMFILDSPEAVRTEYNSLHPEMRGALFFAYGDARDPNTCFLLYNNIEKHSVGDVASVIKSGYIVRTMAGTQKDAEVNDLSRAKAGFGSGVQIISTDYLRPDARINDQYFVHLPSTLSLSHAKDLRCSPVFALQYPFLCE